MAQAHPGFVDDDDLPTEVAPAPATQPRDPLTGQYLPPNNQQQRVPALRQENAQRSQSVQNVQGRQPALSAYSLAKAQEYGIDTAGLDQPVLDRILLAVESRLSATARQNAQAEAARVAAAAPAPAPPAIDWGEGDDGKPLTEDQAKALYPRPVFNAIKNQGRLDNLEAENKRLREEREQEVQQRNQRAVVRQVHAVFATRPDLFGTAIGQAAEGTPEHYRYMAAAGFIQQLVAAGKQTNPKADAERALELFGAAPQPAKPNGRGPSPAEIAAAGYRNGELARPSGRQGTEQTTRRQAMIDQEVARMRENGAAVTAAGGDDDDDLPE